MILLSLQKVNMVDNLNLSDELRARFDSLPRVVQGAITSSDVQTRLRSLAETYKLHLDQWDVLENTVILALLGFVPVTELAHHIETEVGMSRESAGALANNISLTIFEPIRKELERQLEHPAAQEKVVTDVEAARAQALQGSRDQVSGVREESVTNSWPTPPVAPSTPPVMPATPPQPPNEIKITRPSESTAYKPGEPSSTRTVVHDDPYRVPPV